MKKPVIRLTLSLVGVLVGIYIISLLFHPGNPPLSPQPKVEPVKVSPTPEPFRTYTVPKIEKKKDYTIVMVGDSMTYALGPHGGTFNEFMNKVFKPEGHGILIDNYASGSTNILSLEEAMNKETTYWDSTFPPLLSRDFDMILIESFGYNPLSQFSIEEGLKKHNEVLEKVIPNLIKTHPKAIIVFVATIAPNKEMYAKPILKDTTAEDRVKQVEERNRYIQNHLDYAKAHNIPIIDIHSKSVDETGDGEIKYINPDDYIHPSFEGVDFIGQTLTDEIEKAGYFPK